MRTPLVVSTILTLTATGALAAGLTGASAQATTAPDTTPTKFALRAAGYGSYVRGGQIPADSSTTAYEALGCTNRAGVDRDNPEADVTVPGLGTLSNVKTRVWTTNRNGVVASNSTDHIEQLTLGGGANGTVVINAIRSVSRAFHDAKGFHAQTLTNVGDITYTDAAGATQTYQELPTPDQPLVIPGVATISVGSSKERHSTSGATATANALLISDTATGSTAQVAHSMAKIDSGITHGVFAGWSAASRARGLGENIRSGRTPLSLMPCQGTDGEERVKSIAHLALGPNIDLRGISSRQMGDQTQAKAFGFERGRVNAVEITTESGDNLLIKNIVGRANVVRTAGGLLRNTNGTDMGEVVTNGEPQSFPDSEEVLTIPGIAKLEREIVTRSKNGISVISLRITLLDGSGAVIDLGQANLAIRDSGL